MKPSRVIRDNCRDMTHWIEKRLRDPVYCSSESGQISAQKTLSALKEKALADESDYPESISKLLMESGIDPDFIKEDKPGKGEFARQECQFAVTLGIQLRFRQRSLAQKNYGMADDALLSVCDEGPTGADDYLKFMR